MFRRRFYFVGDGEKNEISVDLSKSPVGMTFIGGKYPAAAYLAAGGIEVQMHDEGVLQFIWDSPLPPNSVVQADVTLYYD